MIIVKDKSNCSGCGACSSICPKGCIDMIEDEEGFLYPKINKEKCINCGLCSKVCPIINSKKESKEAPICYAAYNKDSDIRMDSSSGGIFDLICRHILSNSGVVYGASFNENNNVEHIRVIEVSDLHKIRKSKYVQSDINKIYLDVKKDLLDTKIVLFSGTPCQVEGLNSFLGRKYDNLYTIDIVCHGVPSKKVWQKYLKEKHACESESINFRDKANGWDNYSIKIITKEKKYDISHREDTFMKTFLSECNIRPSCFNCRFKKVNRLSDVTLGDFWGVKEQCPEMYDEKGVSAILIHSIKGKELFENIKDNIVLKEVKFEQIVHSNSAYYKSIIKNKKRNKFFKNLDKYDLDKLCKKYCNKTTTDRVISKVKRVIKKIVSIKKN